MQYDSREYQTDNLDLAAYLAAHGREPAIYLDCERKLAIFVFRRDDSLLALIEEFSSGAATVSAKAILSSRRRHFHAIRQLKGGSHAM